MPPFTKRAIVDSFLNIAARKSFDKITVRDIVDDCGVNRNTFYYYFQDIYGVIEELCESEHISARSEDAVLSPTDSFRRLADFTLKHQKAVQNIYASVGRDGMTTCLFSVLARSIRQYFLSLGGDDCPPGDVDFLTDCCRHALMGIYTDWLKSGCKEDPEAICGKFTRLFGNLFPAMLSGWENIDKTRKTSEF